MEDWLRVDSVDSFDGVYYLSGKLGFRDYDPQPETVYSEEIYWTCDYGQFFVSDFSVDDTARSKIAELIKSILVDPYTVRSASISNRMDTSFGQDAPSMACVKFNSRNRMGGYVVTVRAYRTAAR